MERYHEDPLLPSCPPNKYRTDWVNWYAFLGSKKNRFYKNYEEAQKAARSIGIVSGPDYQLRYDLDSKLPSSPHTVYADEWSGWRNFLGEEVKKRVKRPGSPTFILSQNSKAQSRHTEPAYESFDKAREAARSLGVSCQREYVKSYFIDPKLRANPQRIYKASWRGWRFFLTGEEGRFYPTYEEAKTAVRALNIRTAREYRIRYKEDPRLPANPHKIYSEQWESFPSFTGGHSFTVYSNLQDASKATRQLGIKSALEYGRRYREDTRLPRAPDQVYCSEWKSWHAFLGKDEPRFYETYSKAKQAAKRLKIRTQTEYVLRYKEDAHLPSNPSLYYPDWSGWPAFFGRPRIAPYCSFKEASRAAIALGIKTVSEYSIRYKEDPRLPSNPCHTYRREWSGYPHFLGLQTRSFYKTYAEASHAAKALNIRSYKEYKKLYHGDPLLPSNPQSRYKADWTNWHAFLGLEKKRFYESYEDAKRVIQRAGASTVVEYAKLAQQDERLPSSPKMVYKTDWQGWGSFLAPRKPRFYESYGEAQKAARSIGIVSGPDYKLRYRLDSKLPSNPHTFYADEWSGWRSFLGDEAKKRVKRPGSPTLIPSQHSKSRDTSDNAV